MEPEASPGEGRNRTIAAIALALVLSVFLRETLFGGKVLCQADHLLAFAPWSEVADPGHEPGNPLLEDQSILMVPWLQWAARQVRAGELPLWNPYNYGGQPIHAANSGAFLWPTNLLCYVFPTLGFYAWSALLRLFAAGFFMLLLLRRIGVSRWAALPASVAFALCGFMVAWLNHPHSNVALLLPLILLEIERVARSPRWKEAGLFALVVGAQFLGGHAQTSLHLLLVAGAYVLFRSLVAFEGIRLSRRGWGVLAVGGALGGLLAAPQMLPFAEYLRESQGVIVLERQEQTADVSIRDAAVVMVAPDAHGGPHTHDYTGPQGRNLNYSEIIGGYVGRLTLLLALAAVVLGLRDPRVRFFGVLALVAALVAWHVWPAYEVFRLVPKLRSTNPMRLLLFVAFALAVLASLGLDRILARFGLEGRRAAAVGLAAFLLVASELVAWGSGYNPAIDPRQAYPPTPVTDFLARDETVHRVQGLHRTTLRSSANLAYGISMLTGYDKIEFRPMAELAFQLTRGEVAGPFISEIDVLDRSEALPLASLLGIKYLVAEEALPPPLVEVFHSPGGVGVYENPTVLPRAFVATGFLVIEDPKERVAHLGSPAMDPRVAVLHGEPEQALALRAFSGSEGGPAGSVTLELHAPREVHLRARMERPGLVVLADAWNPGWSATVDGVPVGIERVDHALRGVWVDTGESEIVMRYDPTSVRNGLLFGGLALVTSLALIVGGRRKEEAASGRCVGRP